MASDNENPIFRGDSEHVDIELTGSGTTGSANEQANHQEVEPSSRQSGMEEGQAEPNSPEYSKERPPSYSSMVGKVKRMQSESTSKVDFVKNMAVLIFCGTVCSIILICVMLGWPIAQIVMGSLYKNQCPREHYIPIYLIVGGSFGLIIAVLQMLQLICRCGKKDDEERSGGAAGCLAILMGPMGCFLSIWSIVGAVWIFRIYNDHQSEFPDQSDFCHQTLYLFAFWSILAPFILVGFIIVVGCIIAVVACFCACGQNS